MSVCCHNWYCCNREKQLDLQLCFFSPISYQNHRSIPLLTDPGTVLVLVERFDCFSRTSPPPLISHQIWFVWRWSWCFIYFCPARQPAGALWVSWFIRAEQKQKERQPLSLHLLAYTLMKFSEMKFSATSIGLGRIILKCFITAMVVACGISSFGMWHASFITMR